MPRLPGNPDYRPGLPLDPSELQRVDDQGRYAGQLWLDGTREVMSGPGGHVLRNPSPSVRTLRLTENGEDGRYSFVEVEIPDDGVAFTKLGGVSGTWSSAGCAREVNGNASICADPDEGTIVRAWLSDDGISWSFTHCCPSTCQTTGCVVWYTGYLHLSEISEEITLGGDVEPGQLLGLIGPHSGGAHLHFSLGDGHPLLISDPDPALSSFVGQTLPVSEWLALEEVNLRTPGLPSPRQHIYTTGELEVIRTRTILPLNPSLNWVNVLGSSLHGGYEWYATDLNTLPWDTPLHSDDEVGMPVYAAVSGDDVVSTVEHIQDLGESGWLIVLKHEVNCEEEGTGSGSGSGSGSGEETVSVACCEEPIPFYLCATFGGVLASLGSVTLTWDDGQELWYNLSVPDCTGAGLVVAFECQEDGTFILRGNGATQFLAEGEVTTCEPFLWEVTEFIALGECPGVASVSIEPGPCEGSGTGSGSGYTWEEPPDDDAPPEPVTLDLVTNVCPEFDGEGFVIGLTVEKKRITLPPGTTIGDPFCEDDPDDCCGSGSGVDPGADVACDCCDAPIPATLYLTISDGGSLSLPCLEGTYELTWTSDIHLDEVCAWQSEDLDICEGKVVRWRVWCEGETPESATWFIQLWYKDSAEEITPTNGFVSGWFQSGEDEITCDPFYIPPSTGAPYYFLWTVTETAP